MSILGSWLHLKYYLMCLGFWGAAAIHSLKQLSSRMPSSCKSSAVVMPYKPDPDVELLCFWGSFSTAH